MKLKDLLRIVRVSNLFIIICTQLLCWFCLIKPFEHFIDEPLFLNFPNAILLSIATALIAAAGYIINDYFDVKIDAINRPQKSLIGKDIDPKAAIVFHTICNIIGIGIFTFLAYRLHSLRPLIIPIACTILLWFYSTHFKRQFLIGNIVVAILTALSLNILIAYEPSTWPHFWEVFLTDHLDRIKLNPIWMLIAYSGFAFLLTWIREIIKDLEDFKGDAEDGCVTMPIKLGIGKTINFTRMLLAITSALLVFASIVLFTKSWYILALYLLLALALPLTIIFFNINKSTATQHFAKLSKYLKILMVLGIATLIILYFSQYQS